MTLRERVAAIAAEYQREPRHLSSVTVGRMLDEWLAEPDVPPGPCMDRAPTLITGVPQMVCTLAAGHAGGHTDGIGRWQQRLGCSLHGGVSDADGWIKCSIAVCGHPA